MCDAINTFFRYAFLPINVHIFRVLNDKTFCRVWTLILYIEVTFEENN